MIPPHITRWILGAPGVPAKPYEEPDGFAIAPASTAKPCQTKRCKGLVQNADAARFCDACKAVKNAPKTKNRTYKRGMK